MIEEKDINAVEASTETPDYPWDHDGEGRGVYSDEREETGDEEDCYDNIAGILRY